MALIQPTDHGLYCELGGFFIDPWRPVEKAVITHAHADYARPGSNGYLCAADGLELLRTRLGVNGTVESLPYREGTRVNDVTVSFHPAGHILGSAQVRVEYGGEVWVVSGDYKRDVDATCEPMEIVPCHTFISEFTFGLPIYRWPRQEDVFEEINA